jgi:Ca2+-transporting ATPase
VGEEQARSQAFGYVVGKAEAFMPLSRRDQQMIQNTVAGVLQARGQIGFIALLGLLWSSLGFFQALVSGVNQAWGGKALNWWKLPLKNLLMVGVLASALALGVIAPAILKIVQVYMAFAGAWIASAVSLAGVLIPTLVLFYGFLLFYKLAPRHTETIAFKTIWLPALIVTALLQLCQQLFVFYSTHLTNFNAVYGTFGGVIALMLWTYFSGMVIIFGGCLCAKAERMKDEG